MKKSFVLKRKMILYSTGESVDFFKCRGEKKKCTSRMIGKDSRKHMIEQKNDDVFLDEQKKY
jgi:hypothetical protein